MSASSGASVQGLTAAAAAERLRQDGYNELAPPRHRNVFMIAVEVAKEPMFLLLLAAGTLYMLLGDVGEAAMLLGFICATMAMTIAQDLRTSRVLEALRDLSSPRATVIRDGQPLRVPGREVVEGDLMLLDEGDRIAADGTLLECHDLVVDESLLTGESVPVRKSASLEAPMSTERQVFGGTLVVQGGAQVRVTATGERSALGRIGEVLSATAEVPSPLQRQFRGLVRRFAIVAVSASVLLVLVLMVSGTEALHALLAGITLAMSALPEEFPVIVTVFFAVGAWRISRQRVLTRRQDAIETLGATTVLCVDKTGTLTENRMRIVRLWVAGESLDLGAETPQLPERFHRLVEFGILASEEAPFDPMEQAFHRLGRDALSGTEHLHQAWQIVHEYSLSPELMAMTHVWRGDGASHWVVATKGAPEAVTDLCHLEGAQRDAALAAATAMADGGLRVLGVARAELPHGAQWPERQHDIPFGFIGLIGLEDPLRAEVPQAIRQAHEAGCRVVMITGDYPRTAEVLAQRLGIGGGPVITGDRLARMEHAELRQCLHDARVFARIVPLQKLRLVQALKENGEIVAMTGDGVNDAPALKAADIGVAMGRRGTDVAREAADLVLLDDDFGALVATVRQGRRIFDNLRKALAYTLAVHVPIVGMSLLPALLGRPLMLLPALVVFFEMVINPSCALVFESEAEEADVMRRPPRDPREPLFGGRPMWLATMRGALVLAITVAAYLIALARAWPEERSRTLVFTIMLAGNLALLAASRIHNQPLWRVFGRGNRVFGWVCAVTLCGLMLVTQLPWLERVFHFAHMGAEGWGVAGAGFVATVLVLELLRRIFPVTA